MYLPAMNLRWPLMMGNMGNMGQPHCVTAGGGQGHHVPTGLPSPGPGQNGPGLPQNHAGPSGTTGGNLRPPAVAVPSSAQSSTTSAFKTVSSSGNCAGPRDAQTSPPHSALTVPPASQGLQPGIQHGQNAAAAAAAAAAHLQGFCGSGVGGGVGVGVYPGGMDERTAAVMMGLKETAGGGPGQSAPNGHYGTSAPPPTASAAATSHMTHPAFPMSVPMWFNPTQTAYSLFLGGEKALAASQYLAATDPFAKAAAANPFFDLARMGHYPLGKKLFGCPQCRYITDRKNNLKRHVATMHQECDKALECCGVVFKNKASLRDHVLIFHSNGYMCRFCGRNFCRKALLKRHLTVHSGQKDYICSQCDYATSHKSNLERHKKVHERQTTDSEDNDMDGSPTKDEPPLCTSTTPSFSVASLFSQHPPHVLSSISSSGSSGISRNLCGRGGVSETGGSVHSTTSEHHFSSDHCVVDVSGGSKTDSLTVKPYSGHHNTNSTDDDLPLSPIDGEEDGNTLINVVDLPN